jgi:hypothetical protein
MTISIYLPGGFIRLDVSFNTRFVESVPALTLIETAGAINMLGNTRASRDATLSIA